MENNLKPTLNWEVCEKPLKIVGLKSGALKALYRSDNREILSIRSAKYRTLKNAELLNLVRRICSKGNFTLAGLSDFNGGRKVMAYLRNTDPGLRIGNLEVEEFMLVGNSHDASSKIFIGTANRIIRCTNQFSKKLRVFALRHIRAMDFSDEEIGQFINFYEKGRGHLYQSFDRLKSTSIAENNVEQLLNALFPDKEGVKDKCPSLSRKLAAADIEKETGALGMNAFGLFNGITWYTSHDLRNANQSLGSVTGRAAELNAAAFAYCMSLN